MKFNRRSGRLAVGTEEGYVCLYSVVDDGLDFVKVLDKQEGRIFCLDWHTGFVTSSIFFCLLLVGKKIILVFSETFFGSRKLFCLRRAKQ